MPSNAHQETSNERMNRHTGLLLVMMMVSMKLVLSLLASATLSQAFVLPSITSRSSSLAAQNGDVADNMRRATFAVAAGLAVPTLASAEEESAPKFMQEYSTFTPTDEGWSYRDVKVGAGDVPNVGDRVVFEWSGYTIGYFGRPFEARKGPQGGAFDKDQDFARTVLGSGKLVKGLECGFSGMHVGGIRQILVPFGELSYPSTDMAHDQVGPKPSTFSGQRALNFVLENPRVDRTLLFNVKLVRVDKPTGSGGFLKG